MVISGSKGGKGNLDPQKSTRLLVAFTSIRVVMLKPILNAVTVTLKFTIL